MAKGGKRGRDDYEADDFVSDDEGTASKSKKTKKAGTSSSSGSENKFFELSSGRQPRRLDVTEFKGTHLINLREYYEKDGDYLPTKKGISLNVDQYKNLLKAIPALNAQLKERGIDIGGSTDAMEEDENEEQAEEEKPKRSIKTKKVEKANIEATSDEDEE